MKTLAALLPLIPAVLAADDAPTSAGGGAAIALAALVAEHSPLVSPDEKAALEKLLDGKSGFPWPANKAIVVTLSAVTCEAGNVDILARSCVLTFGKDKASVAGREAHELAATLVEVGVRPDGAAGRIYEALSALTCTINPTAAAQGDGSGADCVFKSGVP